LAGKEEKPELCELLLEEEEKREGKKEKRGGKKEKKGDMMV
jgi:hypothetical protein